MALSPLRKIIANVFVDVLGRARSPQRAADGYGEPSLPLRLRRISPAGKNLVSLFHSSML
jgi:hypothetical protein